MDDYTAGSATQLGGEPMAARHLLQSATQTDSQGQDVYELLSLHHVCAPALSPLRPRHFSGDGHRLGTLVASSGVDSAMGAIRQIRLVVLPAVKTDETGPLLPPEAQ